MHVRWITASTFVALASAASAQSPAVLGKADAAFAKRLNDAGYTDLAEKLVGAIERSGKSGADESVGIKALHLDLRLEVAKREPDIVKRKDLLKAILEEKENLVQQY